MVFSEFEISLEFTTLGHYHKEKATNVRILRAQHLLAQKMFYTWLKPALSIIFYILDF